jgi:hypothetical protein
VQVKVKAKDLPAGAHFVIAGTALFCSFDRYEEGLTGFWDIPFP